VAIGAAKFAMNRLVENLFVNKNAPLATANIKTVNVQVTVTFLTSTDFLFSRQSDFGSPNSHPFRPDERKKPTNQQDNRCRNLTHKPSLHLQVASN